MRNRLIASVFVYNGYCYQTLSYFNYRPLGKLSNILEILDQHQVDEIFISNRYFLNHAPDKHLLDEIRTSKISTPITFSGGISNKNHVNLILQNNIDRVGVNSSLWNLKSLESVIKAIGIQGVVGIIPFMFDKDNF